MHRSKLAGMQVSTCLLAAGLCSVAAPALPADGPAQARILDEEQIRFSNDWFDGIVAKTPHRETAVTAFFTEPISIAEPAAHATELRLTIEGFRHGDAGRSGGYSLSPGEPLADRRPI